MKLEKKLSSLALALALFLPLCACDQTVDEGQLDSGVNPDTGATDGGSTDALSPDAVVGKTVQVTYAGKSHTVPLLQPTSVTFEGTPHARLSDVITLALPGAAQAGLKADFESSDGYRPSTKTTCDKLVLKAGTVFKQAYLDVSTRKLRWDASLKYPGCLYVKDVAKVIVTDL